MTIVAAHQIDLLPYSGFWYKMIKADIFDLRLYDQFTSKGYSRRVVMRETWASIPVHKNSSRLPMIDVRIDPDTAANTLADAITGRYRGAEGWERYGKALVEQIRDIHTDRLWQFNLELIILVRDLLEITTPLSIGKVGAGAKSARIIDGLLQYTDPVYLSGTGAMTYMGDCQEFTDASIPVVWSRHHAITGESILTVLMDHEDPMQVILMEKDPSESDNEHNTPLQGVLR